MKRQKKYPQSSWRGQIYYTTHKTQLDIHIAHAHRTLIDLFISYYRYKTLIKCALFFFIGGGDSSFLFFRPCRATLQSDAFGLKDSTACKHAFISFWTDIKFESKIVFFAFCVCCLAKIALFHSLTVEFIACNNCSHESWSVPEIFIFILHC